MTIIAGLIIAVLLTGGLVLIVLNGRKLISDWPRPKPVHNVDLAWVQIYLGLALVVAAWFIFTDPSRILREPTPTAVNPETMAQGDTAKARR